MSSGTSLRLEFVSSTFQAGAGGQGESSFAKLEARAIYLTEIILPGCVAERIGRKLGWNGPNMRASNAVEVAQFVKRVDHKGWKLQGMVGCGARCADGRPQFPEWLVFAARLR